MYTMAGIESGSFAPQGKVHAARAMTRGRGGGKIWELGGGVANLGSFDIVLFSGYFIS
jgi:hypothetical protein